MGYKEGDLVIGSPFSSMEHTLTLTTFTYGGEAMGRLEDGRAIFVPFGLPGERVRIALTEEKRNFARGEIVEILDTSPLRVTPRCIHFGICGGCHYQHLPYEEQLKAKTEILRDQLRRIGKIENPPVHEMVPNSSPWNYRNHVQFHLTEEGKLGYMMAQTPKVFAIQECHLPEGSINAMWPQLEFESEMNIERVQNHPSLKSRQGFRSRMSLRKTLLSSLAMIILRFVFSIAIFAFPLPHSFKSIRLWLGRWSSTYLRIYQFLNQILFSISIVE